MTASLAAAHVCEARVGWAALKRHNASVSVPTNETSPWQADSNLTSYVHRHRRELGDLSGWLDGRSTWYGGPSGPGPDGMSILKGSCGYGAKLRNHFVAAAQTMGGYNWGLTGECGRCYEVMCVHGKTRGTAGSSLGPWEGCLDAGRRSVVVQITDSCPCFHPNGGSNKRWCAAMPPDQHVPTSTKLTPARRCCGDARHLDLSYAAFDGAFTCAYRDAPCLTADWQNQLCSHCAARPRGSGPQAPAGELRQDGPDDLLRVRHMRLSGAQQ